MVRAASPRPNHSAIRSCACRRTVLIVGRRRSCVVDLEGEKILSAAVGRRAAAMLSVWYIYLHDATCPPKARPCAKSQLGSSKLVVALHTTSVASRSRSRRKTAKLPSRSSLETNQRKAKGRVLWWRFRSRTFARRAPARARAQATDRTVPNTALCRCRAARLVYSRLSRPREEGRASCEAQSSSASATVPRGGIRAKLWKTMTHPQPYDGAPTAIPCYSCCSCFSSSCWFLSHLSTSCTATSTMLPSSDGPLPPMLSRPPRHRRHLHRHHRRRRRHYLCHLHRQSLRNLLHHCHQSGRLRSHHSHPTHHLACVSTRRHHRRHHRRRHHRYRLRRRRAPRHRRHGARPWTWPTRRFATAAPTPIGVAIQTSPPVLFFGLSMICPTTTSHGTLAASTTGSSLIGGRRRL